MASQRGQTTCKQQAFDGCRRTEKFSRRERAAYHLQNTTDLARAAVGCMGVLDGNLVYAFILLADNGWTYHHRLGILMFVMKPFLPMRM